jgi:hypothetical protein
MTCCENTLFYVLLLFLLGRRLILLLKIYFFKKQISQFVKFKTCDCFIFHSLGSVKKKHEGKSVNNTGYFTSDNDEPGGIENATHNTFPKLTRLF